MIKKTTRKLKTSYLDLNTAESFLLTWKMSVSTGMHMLSNMSACFIWKIACALFPSPSNTLISNSSLDGSVSTLAHSGHFHGHVFLSFYYFCSQFVITKHYRIKYALSSSASFHLFQWFLWICTFYSWPETKSGILLFCNEGISLRNWFYLSFTTRSSC